MCFSFNNITVVLQLRFSQKRRLPLYMVTCGKILNILESKLIEQGLKMAGKKKTRDKQKSKKTETTTSPVSN